MKRFMAVGALVLTPLVWPVGVLLLWLSSAWTRRDKMIGSLLPPGGLAFAWLLATEVRSSCPTQGTGSCQLGSMYAGLHPGPAGFDHVFGALVFTAAALVPMITMWYLAMRLRARWGDV
ncbi:MAG TPA: hypothetical protein VLR46_13855 [Candidatus Dormibacteraeota bacterium]|nr:hypothetical protein [Candidatus Dormibacteraeota bacterium]